MVPAMPLFATSVSACTPATLTLTLATVPATGVCRGRGQGRIAVPGGAGANRGNRREVHAVGRAVDLEAGLVGRVVDPGQVDLRRGDRGRRQAGRRRGHLGRRGVGELEPVE